MVAVTLVGLGLCGSEGDGVFRVTDCLAVVVRYAGKHEAQGVV